MDKNKKRIVRAKSTRSKIRSSGTLRLTVHRTSKHIYAQVIDDSIGKTLINSSTLSSGVKSVLKYSGNIDAAKQVGLDLAMKASECGISNIAFDRSGYKYHGRIKALADAAREAGLKF